MTMVVQAMLYAITILQAKELLNGDLKTPFLNHIVTIHIEVQF
jgi:hypothetical protein